MQVDEDKIVVSGRELSIRGLKEIFREVANLNMGREQSLREIMKRVRLYNYIPNELEDEIQQMLWAIFLKEYGKYMPKEEK